MEGLFYEQDVLLPADGDYEACLERLKKTYVEEQLDLDELDAHHGRIVILDLNVEPLVYL